VKRHFFNDHDFIAIDLFAPYAYHYFVMTNSGRVKIFYTTLVFYVMTYAGMAESGESGSGNGSASDNNSTPQEIENNMGLDLGATYKQCSISRSAANTMSVTEIRSGNSTTSVHATPHIGSLNWEGDSLVLKTFHGGRISKNGRVTNECISASFDPRNLLCLGCDTPHHILSKNKPPVIVFADQNFVPFLPGGADNCIAVCRAENPTLNELADLAMEVIDRGPLPAGTTLLFGSCSHLFRGGGLPNMQRTGSS
jgi:hypothetical protein